MGCRFSWNGIIVFKKKKTTNVKYFLRVIDKKVKRVLNAFTEIVKKSNQKPNKLWVDQRIEIYNKLMQEWLHNNDIYMYSAHNESKSIITESFIKTLTAKIYKKW